MVAPLINETLGKVSLLPEMHDLKIFLALICNSVNMINWFTNRCNCYWFYGPREFYMHYLYLKTKNIHHVYHLHKVSPYI